MSIPSIRKEFRRATTPSYKSLLGDFSSSSQLENDEDIAIGQDEEGQKNGEEPAEPESKTVDGDPIGDEHRQMSATSTH